MSDAFSSKSSINPHTYINLIKSNLLNHNEYKTYISKETSAWFDASHQHFILHNKASINELIIFPCQEKNAITNMYTKQFLINDIPQEYKSSLVLVKLSLDRELLAIQVSLTIIIVLDIKNSRQWIIQIKSSSSSSSFDNDNKILNDGIVWSDHGGGSQDLVIVTIRGLELYKISSIRNQCKLSRAVTQHCYSYWYEPNHRLLLMSSPGTTLSNSVTTSSITNNSQNRNHPKALSVLTMTGIFLRVDKSETAILPKLELPPPEKSPRFELGPGISKNGIFLVSLYGKPFCIALRRIRDEDYLFLYLITKTSVVRAHVLSLNCQTSSLKVSIEDNVLVCHFLPYLNKILLFDINLSCNSKVVTLNDEETIVLLPICQPSDIILGEIVSQKEECENTATISSNDKTDLSSELIAVSGLVDNTNSVESSTSIPIQLSSDTSMSILSNSNDDSPKSRTMSQIDCIPADLIDPSASKSRLLKRWQLFQSCWIWDSDNFILWKLKLDLQSITRVIHDPKKCISFLVSRGQNFDNCYRFQIEPKNQTARLPSKNNSFETLAQANETNMAYDQDISKFAKLLIIEYLTSSLKNLVGLSWLEVLFKAMIKPYARHFTYQLNQQSIYRKFLNERDNQELANQLQSNTNSMNTNIINNPEKRRLGSISNTSNGSFKETTVASLTSAINYSLGSHSPLVSSNSTVNTVNNGVATGSSFQINLSYFEPLEYSYDLHEFLPDIASISTKARKLYRKSLSRGESVSNSGKSSVLEPSIESNFNASTQQLSLSETESKKVTSSTLFSPNYPISTRHNYEGELVISQIETLSYVWLPLIHSNEISLDYCSWSLSTYISALRQESVFIHPALSVLLIHVLSAQRKYLHISRLLQLHFFPDVSEIALAALELADIISVTELDTASSTSIFQLNNNTLVPANSMHYRKSSMSSKFHDTILVKSSISTLQQVGIDMLWRLQEYVTVIRWMLGHIRVMEAINICLKKRSLWKTLLSCSAIPASEFFIAAVMKLESIHVECESYKAKTNDIRYHANGEKNEILQTLYNFIREWDSSSLIVVASSVRNSNSWF